MASAKKQIKNSQSRVVVMLWRDKSQRPRGTVPNFLSPQIEFLACKRGNAGKNPGQWGFISGRMDQPGEEPRMTATRELREELQLEVNPGALFYLGDTRKGHKHVHWFTLDFRSCGGDIFDEFGPDDEIAAADWVELSVLQENTEPLHYSAMDFPGLPLDELREQAKLAEADRKRKPVKLKELKGLDAKYVLGQAWLQFAMIRQHLEGHLYRDAAMCEQSIRTMTELVEICDCGSTGGFGKGQSREVCTLFARWDWLYRKYVGRPEILKSHRGSYETLRREFYDYKEALS